MASEKRAESRAHIRIRTTSGTAYWAIETADRLSGCAVGQAGHLLFGARCEIADAKLGWGLRQGFWLQSSIAEGGLTRAAGMGYGPSTKVKFHEELALGRPDFRALLVRVNPGFAPS